MHGRDRGYSGQRMQDEDRTAREEETRKTTEKINERSEGGPC